MLELRDLAAVRSHTVLFRRLNLLLHAGEALRVAGPNGAGKTTLLRILCGLTEPVRGVVCWDGTPIRDLGDDYRALHDRLGLTTVMITHDMAEAVLLADRIAVMRAGRLVAEGSPRELAANGEVYVSELLGTPRRQAERLQQLLPKDAR